MKAFAATATAVLLSLAAGTAAAGDFNNSGYPAGHGQTYASANYGAYGNPGYSTANRNTRVMVGTAIGAAVGYVIANGTQPRGYANGYYRPQYNSRMYAPAVGHGASYGYGSSSGYYNPGYYAPPSRARGHRGW